MSAGAVSGFRNVDIAARLYGTQGIRYTGAVIPFRLETGRLVLEKGTRANAPKGDPMDRFLTAEGTIGPGGVEPRLRREHQHETLLRPQGRSQRAASPEVPSKMP